MNSRISSVSKSHKYINVSLYICIRVNDSVGMCLLPYMEVVVHHQLYLFPYPSYPD